MRKTDTVGPLAAFARLMSRLGHPLVFITITAGIVLTKQLPARTAGLVLAALFLSVILPLVFLIQATTRSKENRGADVSNREERRRFYPLAIPFSSFGAFLMWWMQAPPFVLRSGFVMLALFIIAAVVNLWVKISLHALFATYCSMILWQVGVIWAVVGTVLAVLVFWSRLFLSRHTLMEIVAGIALGLGGGLLVGWWPI